MEALGLSWGALIAQLFNVIILIWLLTVLLYRPVLNMLNERAERIAASLRDAEQVKVQLARANDDYNAKMAEAQRDAAALLAQAQERARAQADQILAQARQDADSIRAEARVQAQQERDQLLRSVKQQVAELVTLTASRVLQAEVRAGAHDRLIDESLAELGRNN